jgi:hypothetical protein
MSIFTAPPISAHQNKTIVGNGGRIVNVGGFEVAPRAGFEGTTAQRIR